MLHAWYLGRGAGTLRQMKSEEGEGDGYTGKGAQKREHRKGSTGKGAQEREQRAKNREAMENRRMMCVPNP